MKHHSPLLLLTLLMLTFWVSQSAHGAPSLTVNPASGTTSQTYAATYNVTLNGATPSATYALAISGLPPGSVYSFLPTTIGTGESSTLTVQTIKPPLYCPNNYSFNITATNVALSSDRASKSARLVVTQLGPSLSVTVTTDKATYSGGDTVQISVSMNRAAQGTLTISPPTGPASAYNYQYTSPASFTKSYQTTAGLPGGKWNATFVADDYCGGVNGAVAYFDLVNSYSVSITLAGLPPSIAANIQVDGQSEGSLAGSQTKSLSFNVGTQHVISVDQYVNGSTGVRYYASQNSWSVGSAGGYTFSYVTQYYLTVGTIPSGLQLSGSGWYDANSVVQTEAPQIDPTGAYTFSYWQLDGFQQSGNPIQITMDKPHTATASFVPNAVTITTTSSGVRTYTSSITTTVIATGVTASTSTVTQVGTQTASTFLTTTIISGETGTFATTAAQTFTSTVIDTQLKNPNLELLYGSVVTVSVLIIATPIASRALSRKQIVCSKCGFRNPPTAPSFCVNCGESLKGSRV